MKFKSFVSPHVHIQSLDSASTPEAFVQRELELGTGSIVCTDHGTLGACPKVYQLAKENGLIPILGIEGYFRDDDDPILKAAGIAKGEDGTYLNYTKYHHITMAFQDQAAYETGVRLISKADERAERHGSERKPLFGWEELEEIGAQNVTFCSSCLIGMVQRHLLDHGDPVMAAKYYEKLRSLVKPGNFYVEVFPHRLTHNWVKGIFITLEDGTKIKYHEKKKLLISSGEVDADSLVAAFNRKGFGEQSLVAVKNYSKWADLEPKRILKVEKIEGYIQNECTPHAPDSDIQLGCNKFVVELARKYGDKILISDDSHYAYEDEKDLQDIKLQAGGGSWRFFGNYARQSSDTAFKYFNTYMGVSAKEFEGWVDNSYEFQSKFKNFELKPRRSLPTSFYPEDTAAYTMELIKKHGRMDWKNPAYVERLAKEFEVLHANGTVDLLPYFFVLEEVCAMYEEKGYLTGIGRGSAAGVLLSYLLGITHADPLKYDLSLDRFLTVDRIQTGKLPDIDQDLPSRELLVGEDGNSGWLKERFGENYAQISVEITLKLKSSIKDVCRVSYGGRVPEDVEELTKKMQVPPQGISDRDFVFGYEAAGSWVQGSIEYDAALKTFISRYPTEWTKVVKLLGLYRQQGRHPCGYVITNEPVSNFIPLTSVSGVKVTQYNAPAVEYVGGLKMDFLTLNTLNDIREAVALIQDRSGVKLTEKEYVIDGKRVPKIRVLPMNGKLYDIWDLPEDQEVFRKICEGDTETVFQFGTSGAKKWLKQFNHKVSEDDGEVRKALSSVRDLATFTALDRPGPLDAYVEDERGNQHNMLVEFANRAKGFGAVGELPILSDILPETLGVLVFQESLMKVFQIVGKTTGLQANSFREHVGKKKMAEIYKDKEIFMAGAIETVGAEQADALWDQMQTFGQYGFNKSHAITYSLTGYVAAFLKHHFSLEWWCSVLRNADRNEINEKFWGHCGHLVDMPDVRYSEERFEIQGERIRAPITLLHGIGVKAHEQLCKWAPYSSIEDFCDKIQKHKESKATIGPDLKKKLGRNALDRGIVATLIVSGAMDGLFPPGTDVYDMLKAYEDAMAKMEGKKWANKVTSRFGTIDPIVRYQHTKQVLPPYPKPVLPILMEVGTPGIEMAGERATFINDKKERFSIVSMNEIQRLEMFSPWPSNMTLNVAVVGYVVEDRRFVYQKNKQAAALTLDIDGGRIEYVQWPDRRTGKLPSDLPPSLTGGIVGVVLNKYREDKPFSIDKIHLIVNPLEKPKKEESS